MGIPEPGDEVSEDEDSEEEASEFEEMFSKSPEEILEEGVITAADGIQESTSFLARHHFVLYPIIITYLLISGILLFLPSSIVPSAFTSFRTQDLLLFQAVFLYPKSIVFSESRIYF
jgi:hypothetical protein